jgi:GMP synthase-like glutamine amidotransferase
MRLHYLQHEPFEGLGSIEEWAKSRDFTISSTKLYNGELMPTHLNDIDWLVIMGGSMSVNDETELPWLIPEKKFVLEAIAAGKVVIGICLGAQMIANVLGSKVYKNAEKEIGWFPIVWDDAVIKLPLFQHVPTEMQVLHWHGETFDLPQNALRIAHSAACLNQGFLYKDKVLGLQFHMEFNRKSTDEMLSYCAHELKQGTYIQTSEEIFAGSSHIDLAQKTLFGILDALLS